MVFSLNQILNVSPNLQIAIYLENKSSLPNLFSVLLKSMSFPLAVPNQERIFSPDQILPQNTAVYCLKSEKIGPMILLNCEVASLTVSAIRMTSSSRDIYFHTPSRHQTKL